MPIHPPPPRLATAADLADLPDAVSAEVLGGRLVPGVLPGFDHSEAHSSLAELLAPLRSRRGGGSGGWWVASAVDIELERHEVYCPDLVGWRWENHARRPGGSPVSTRPDWVCEILDRATAQRDRVHKLLTYHRVGVPYYWLLDPVERSLTVLRWQPAGYLVALVAAEHGHVRAEPFESLELSLGALFGLEMRVASEEQSHRAAGSEREGR